MKQSLHNNFIKHLTQFVLMAITLFSLSANSSDFTVIKEESVHIKKVEIIAQLKGFLEKAVYDDFEDGTTEIYDLSVFEIIQPAKYQGQTLNVQHYSTETLDSKWKNIGVEYLISLDEKLISKSSMPAWTNVVEIIRVSSEYGSGSFYNI